MRQLIVAHTVVYYKKCSEPCMLACLHICMYVLYAFITGTTLQSRQNFKYVCLYVCEDFISVISVFFGVSVKNFH